MTLASVGDGPCKPPQGILTRVTRGNQLEERNYNRTETVGNSDA